MLISLLFFVVDMSSEPLKSIIFCLCNLSFEALAIWTLLDACSMWNVPLSSRVLVICTCILVASGSSFGFSVLTLANLFSMTSLHNNERDCWHPPGVTGEVILTALTYGYVSLLFSCQSKAPTAPSLTSRILFTLASKPF